MLQEWLTIEEIAEELRVSEETVRRWIFEYTAILAGTPWYYLFTSGG